MDIYFGSAYFEKGLKIVVLLECSCIQIGSLV